MIGTTVEEQYRILDQLAGDDRGEVYLARVLTTNEVVNLKFLNPDALDPANQEAMRRFQREMTLLGGLRDTHIVRLYKHGQHDGRQYMVFEHLPGVSLRTIISQMCEHQQGSYGCLNEEQSLRIARQVAYGLGHAHEHKVIHRGLCPEAILVDNNGVVKIIDFRFAKERDSIDITSSGHYAGPHDSYTAPEQRRGQGDRTSDIYSLGAVLYEMLTGKRSISLDPMSMLVMGGKIQIDPPRVHAPTLTPATDALTMRCLAADPAERPPDVATLIQQISELLPSTGKTDSSPVGSSGDKVLADLVERVCQWREFRPPMNEGRGKLSPPPPPLPPPPPSSPNRAWVELENGRRVDMTKMLVRVGRRSEIHHIYPDIAFDDPWVHRRYARIECRGGIWYLSEEAGARHGTSLNGVELRPDEERRLSNGDTIALGREYQSIRFTFRTS